MGEIFLIGAAVVANIMSVFFIGRVMRVERVVIKKQRKGGIQE